MAHLAFEIPLDAQVSEVERPWFESEIAGRAVDWTTVAGRFGAIHPATNDGCGALTTERRDDAHRPVWLSP